MTASTPKDASASASITRSTGVTLVPGAPAAGGGHVGLTKELDAEVERAAELLRAAYGEDVEIRFNSHGRSGGAWLDTPPMPGSMFRAGDVGVTVSCLDVAQTRATARKLFAADPAYADRWFEAWCEGVQWKAGQPMQFLRINVLISSRALKDPSLANVRADDPVHGHFHGSARTLDEAIAFVQAHAKAPQEIRDAARQQETPASRPRRG